MNNQSRYSCRMVISVTYSNFRPLSDIIIFSKFNQTRTSTYTKVKKWREKACAFVVISSIQTEPSVLCPRRMQKSVPHCLSTMGKNIYGIAFSYQNNKLFTRFFRNLSKFSLHTWWIKTYQVYGLKIFFFLFLRIFSFLVRKLKLV